MESFKSFNLSHQVNKAVTDMGFDMPTPVQKEAIPPILAGRDVIVRAKTGSGKTAAFGLPLASLLEEGAQTPRVLILTPTRELAVQVDTEMKRITKYQTNKTCAVYGQHNITTEIQILDKGVAVVTGTPGRVFDHIQQGTLKVSDIAYLVLDEADKMLDMGFIDQVVRIIKALPKKRQTLLFSATMPFEIQNISWEYMKDPHVIEIESGTKTVDAIKQVYFRVEPHEKRFNLHRLLVTHQPDSCMVFCNTRATVDRVTEFLTRKGYVAEALHGAISQSRRLKTINSFKKQGFTVLVATDVAARGIHVDDLSLVINYDVPIEKDAYVHRIGRTGRAGSGGLALTMVTSEDIMSLYEIEEHIGAMIAESDLPSEADYRSALDKAQAKLMPKMVYKRVTKHKDHKDKPHKDKREVRDHKKKHSPDHKPHMAPGQGQVEVKRHKAHIPAKPVQAPDDRAVRSLSQNEVSKAVAAYKAKAQGQTPSKPSLVKRILSIFKKD